MLVSLSQLDLKQRDSAMQSSFGTAVAMRNEGIARAILQREPKAVEEPNEAGMTHLHTAIEAKDGEVVLLLLKLGANANATVRDVTARTPLYMAIERSLDSVAEALLQAGADPSAADRSSTWTPLHIAARLGCIATLDALLQSKAKVGAVDGQGDTVMHSAVSTCCVEVVERLLKKMPSLAVQPNAAGMTPLHTLGQFADNYPDASVRVLQLLFPHLQGDCNPRDSLGNTPLYYGCRGGMKAAKFCSALIRNGGQLAVPNEEGLLCKL